MLVKLVLDDAFIRMGSGIIMSFITVHANSTEHALKISCMTVVFRLVVGENPHMSNFSWEKSSACADSCHSCVTTNLKSLYPLLLAVVIKFYCTALF